MEIITNNQHIHFSDEPRGDHLTNRCLVCDTRQNGFHMKGWRDQASLDISYDAQAPGSTRIIRHADSVEIDIILQSPPPINIFTYRLDAVGLNFFYQPALTDEELQKLGAKYSERVVGSYAVYHKTKRHNYKRKDGKEFNYGTGKFCHIYRPKAIDADGNEVWCDLSIDVNAKFMRVTAPQDFLDNAKYPVIVDPDFGNNSVGATTLTNTFSRAQRGVIGSETGQALESLSMYIESISSAPQTVYLGLYSDSGTPGTDTSKPLNRLEVMSESSSISTDWLTIAASGSTGVSASTAYWICSPVNGNIEIRADLTGGNYETAYGGSSTLGDPFTYIATNAEVLFSMYGTYSTPTVEETKTIISDAVITVEDQIDVTSDAEIVIFEETSVTSDAHIRTTDQEDILSDASITVEDTQTILSDAAISIFEQVDITSDAVIFTTDISTQFSDATISTTAQQDILSDATVVIAEQTDIAADAFITTGDVTTILSDAHIWTVDQIDITSDSRVFNQLTANVLSDALIIPVDPPTLYAQIFSDTNIQTTETRTITSGAEISRVGTSPARVQARQRDIIVAPHQEDGGFQIF